MYIGLIVQILLIDQILRIFGYVTISSNENVMYDLHLSLSEPPIDVLSALTTILRYTIYDTRYQVICLHITHSEGTSYKKPKRHGLQISCSHVRS